MITPCQKCKYYLHNLLGDKCIHPTFVSKVTKEFYNYRTGCFEGQHYTSDLPDCENVNVPPGCELFEEKEKN
jgi:hypothetical protein